MNTLTLRRYQSSDKEQVKKLYELASVHSEIGYRSGPWESDFDDIEHFYLQDGEFLVGFVDDMMVAMGAYQKMSDEVGHVRRMRVHPDFRRQGFAGQILQGLEETAKKNGLKELRLRTSTKQ